MKVSEFIRYNEIRGRVTFSFNDICEAVSISKQSVAREINRLVSKGRIYIPYKGFYVVIPPAYALQRVVPPHYYIDQLMGVVGKPYYVCLLSAAAMVGAAHQRPMVTQVMTTPPCIKKTNLNGYLDWIYRDEIPSDLLVKINTETGTMFYSSAELTVVDLVQYASHVGGYQRASTVIAEMTDVIDVDKFSLVLPYTSIATFQRLGAILEIVLDEKSLADALYDLLKDRKCRFKSIVMKNALPKKADAKHNRWHVNMNIDIEIDDI